MLHLGSVEHRVEPRHGGLQHRQPEHDRQQHQRQPCPLHHQRRRLRHGHAEPDLQPGRPGRRLRRRREQQHRQLQHDHGRGNVDGGQVLRSLLQHRQLQLDVHEQQQQPRPLSDQLLLRQPHHAVLHQQLGRLRRLPGRPSELQHDQLQHDHERLQLPEPPLSDRRVVQHVPSALRLRQSLGRRHDRRQLQWEHDQPEHRDHQREQQLRALPAQRQQHHDHIEPPRVARHGRLRSRLPQHGLRDLHAGYARLKLWVPRRLPRHLLALGHHRPEHHHGRVGPRRLGQKRHHDDRGLLRPGLDRRLRQRLDRHRHREHHPCRHHHLGQRAGDGQREPEPHGLLEHASRPGRRRRRRGLFAHGRRRPHQALDEHDLRSAVRGARHDAARFHPTLPHVEHHRAQHQRHLQHLRRLFERFDVRRHDPEQRHRLAAVRRQLPSDRLRPLRSIELRPQHRSQPAEQSRHGRGRPLRRRRIQRRQPSRFQVQRPQILRHGVRQRLPDAAGRLDHHSPRQRLRELVRLRHDGILGLPHRGRRLGLHERLQRLVQLDLAEHVDLGPKRVRLSLERLHRPGRALPVGRSSMGQRRGRGRGLPPALDRGPLRRRQRLDGPRGCHAVAHHRQGRHGRADQLRGPGPRALAQRQPCQPGLLRPDEPSLRVAHVDRRLRHGGRGQASGGRKLPRHPVLRHGHAGLFERQLLHRRPGQRHLHATGHDQLSGSHQQRIRHQDRRSIDHQYASDPAASGLHGRLPDRPRQRDARQHEHRARERCALRRRRLLDLRDDQ